MRVFPISNWTEMDVYQYILQEGIELPSIYFSHRRRVFERDGMLMAESPYLQLMDGETVFEADVRFRTVGDMTCTAAFESKAKTIEEIIEEVATTHPNRPAADDRVSEAAMEDRKRRVFLMAPARHHQRTRSDRDHRGELRTWSSSGSPRPARWTTKSTLIGRLLYDSKQIFQDQLEAIEEASLGGEPITWTWRCSPTPTSGSRG